MKRDKKCQLQKARRPPSYLSRALSPPSPRPSQKKKASQSGRPSLRWANFRWSETFLLMEKNLLWPLFKCTFINFLSTEDIRNFPKFSGIISLLRNISDRIKFSGFLSAAKESFPKLIIILKKCACFVISCISVGKRLRSRIHTLVAQSMLVRCLAALLPIYHTGTGWPEMFRKLCTWLNRVTDIALKIDLFRVVAIYAPLGRCSFFGQLWPFLVDPARLLLIQGHPGH